jgi:hypothetical protein
MTTREDKNDDNIVWSIIDSNATTSTMKERADE